MSRYAADELPASAGPTFAASRVVARCIGSSILRLHAFAQCATAGSTVGSVDVVVDVLASDGVVLAETAGAAAHAAAATGRGGDEGGGRPDRGPPNGCPCASHVNRLLRR